MKRLWIVVVVVVVAAAAWWGYRAWQAANLAAEEAAGQDDAAIDELDNVIWASGKLTPIRWAALSPALSGVVSAIPVAEGEWVEAGALLVEVDHEMLHAQVENARAAVAEAEAALAKLRVGATQAELASAEAAVAAAIAQVSLAAGQMLEVEAAIRQAEAQVQIARDQYAEQASHPTAAEVTAADARVAVAVAALEHAQAAYNVVRGDPNIGSMPQSLALYQATASHQAALARSRADQARADRRGTRHYRRPDRRRRSRGRDGTRQGPRRRSRGAGRVGRPSRAQAALDDLLAGATVEELAMAEARLLQAQAAQSMAEANLAQAQVTAPFAGQVGVVQTRVGELATPGVSLLVLGDPAVMHVETTDLRETDVVRLQEGMAVEVTFDALPDRLFQGTITDIAPVSNTDKGSTNYTVKIDVADLDPALRWGMTAFVNIQAPRQP